ncbi:MAG: nucleotidyltransferase family protein [Candidatus Doudnabacteria bacterium]|nr:nucleotidyltransferase family protein [Candidatus Doudnabacteria bacterium]
MTKELRERLTITLKKSVVSMLDQIIDGQKIRNRSHAVEFALTEFLAKEKLKVLILAGGNTVKIVNQREELPKAMVPILGAPLLEHTLKKLRDMHFTEVVISTGKAGDKIQKYFGKGERIGLNISYIKQEGLLSGTAQPLLQTKNLFENTFLLMYGDVLSEINLNDIIEFHQNQRGAIATMALTAVEHVSQWGVAKLVGSKISSFEEKPKKPSTFSHLVNAGIYVLEPAIFGFISKNAERLESDVLPRLAEENKLAGYAFDAKWVDASSL